MFAPVTFNDSRMSRARLLAPSIRNTKFSLGADDVRHCSLCDFAICPRGNPIQYHSLNDVRYSWHLAPATNSEFYISGSQRKD